MAGGHAAELAELLDVVERDRVLVGRPVLVRAACTPRQVQQRIEQHRGVADAEHEAVAVRARSGRPGRSAARPATACRRPAPAPSACRDGRSWPSAPRPSPACGWCRCTSVSILVSRGLGARRLGHLVCSRHPGPLWSAPGMALACGRRKAARLRPVARAPEHVRRQRNSRLRYSVGERTGMTAMRRRKHAPMITRDMLRAGRHRAADRRRHPRPAGADRGGARGVAGRAAGAAAGRGAAGAWVFAYGSLIWNPAIHYVERRFARVHGWHRSFCLSTLAGRGSPELPGLVLGLDRGGACTGAAFLIAEDALARGAADPVAARDAVRQLPAALGRGARRGGRAVRPRDRLHHPPRRAVGTPAAWPRTRWSAAWRPAQRRAGQLGGIPVPDPGRAALARHRRPPHRAAGGRRSRRCVRSEKR